MELSNVAKFLSKPYCDSFDLSVTSENFLDFCKVTKLTLPCNCKPIFLLPLIFKVISKDIYDQIKLDFRKLDKRITHLSIWFSKKNHSADFLFSFVFQRKKFKRQFLTRE